MTHFGPTYRDTQKKYEDEFKMQPNIKNVPPKVSSISRLDLPRKDEEVKLTSEAQNTTKEGVIKQKNPDLTDKNKRKVRELELVELFRACLDRNVL